VTDLSVAWLTAGVAWSNIGQTVLSIPILVADTVSVVVKVCVLHTLLTVAVAWAVAAVTLVVTEALIDRTVISCPPVVTDTALTNTVVKSNEVSVMDTELTVTVLWAGTAVADWVTSTDVLNAGLAYPVVVTVAAGVISTIPMRVQDTSVAVANLWSVTGVAGMEA
jgi:hypothetical protein